MDPERDTLRDKQIIEAPYARASFHRPMEPVIDATQVVDATAHVLGADVTVLRSRRRTRLHVFARHVAVVAADRMAISGAQIANALALSQQGASFIVNRPATTEVEVVVEQVVSRLVSNRKIAG